MSEGSDSEPVFGLIDSGDGRVPTGDLDSIANFSAKYRAREWRDIGNAPPGRFGFIFTHDAKCLRSAVVALHCDCRPELYFGFVGCWLYDLRARPSRSPVAKFALGCGDRRFDVIEYEKVPRDMLDLAVHIVETKSGNFEPEQFEGEYENALKELLRKKQKGERIERPKEPSRTNVVNLMDALRQSVKAESSTARRKISGSGEGIQKPSRSAARQRKAG